MDSTRRTFLACSSTAVATLPTLAHSAANTVTIGVMGTGGRGTSLAKTLAGLPNVVVKTVCDVDESRANAAAATVEKVAKTAPAVVGDFRRILDDKTIDAFICAAPNHWHAPASILACKAGKHVYVEKPCSHNPREGEMLVAAARKANVVVQMGNQRRSWPAIIEAIQKLHEGVIGRCYFAQSWYTNERPSLGTGQLTDPPKVLDYDLWQGPAPRKPFKDNTLHYHWHWFWNWGNGELGNNGVHMIDLLRWGLGVDFPTLATSAGGRYRYQDDQETPDTHVVSFNFPGGKSLTWEGFSCNKLPGEKPIDCLFQGETGSLAIRGGEYTFYDMKNKEVAKKNGTNGDTVHLQNFLAAVRGEGTSNSGIAEAHKSTLLCHLGNIAYRTGKSLHCDPKDGKIINDPEAMKLWGREYAFGWAPK